MAVGGEGVGMDVVRGSAPFLSLSGNAELVGWISRNEARR